MGMRGDLVVQAVHCEGDEALRFFSPLLSSLEALQRCFHRPYGEDGQHLTPVRRRQDLVIDEGQVFGDRPADCIQIDVRRRLAFDETVEGDDYRGGTGRGQNEPGRLYRFPGYVTKAAAPARG